MKTLLGAPIYPSSRALAPPLESAWNLWGGARVVLLFGESMMPRSVRPVSPVPTTPPSSARCLSLNDDHMALPRGTPDTAWTLAVWRLRAAPIAPQMGWASPKDAEPCARVASLARGRMNPLTHLKRWKRLARSSRS